ncbi:MAG: ADP-ribosylglycohydrolase family protein [Ilumatobacteraceae bacterium]
MWNTRYSMLMDEVTQCMDEGAIVPKNILEKLSALDPVRDGWNLPVIDGLSQALDELPRNPELLNSEPNDLSEIRCITRKTHGDKSDFKLNADYAERIDGAWRGRLFGCALGLPYERLGCSTQDGRNVGTQRVQDHLRVTGNFPITDFAKELPDPGLKWGSKSLSNSIRGMEPDDDIHFTIANLFVIEEFGSKFSWSNIADWWIRNLPITEFCTAESQALLNYASRTARWGSDGGAQSMATPEFSRRHLNPYREWIGAQIRTDLWGWISPLRPIQATEFAYRDASWTHERNGIYSSMFFAAMLSLAFGNPDIQSLIQNSLSFIPAKSRLAKAIQTTVEISLDTPDWNAALERTLQELNAGRHRDMSPVHSINNSAICVLALLYGLDEPIQAIKLAVMSGYDTDCNGATVGSISGVLFGSDLSNTSLCQRMGDAVSTRILGNPELRIPDLIQRTISIARKVCQSPS